MTHDPDAAARAARRRRRPPLPSPPPGIPTIAAQLASGRRKPGVVRAFTKYAVVAGTGVAVNLGVLHLLHGVFELGFTRSSAIATEAAIITNYLGNELWTFHLRRLSLRRLVQFNLAALLALVVTVTIATVVKEFVHPLAAQLAGIAAGAGVNFSINFGWTWRR